MREYITPLQGEVRAGVLKSEQSGLRQCSQN